MNSKKREKIINEILSDETDVRAATAPHQEDFPYERDAEAQVTRREFCNFLALTSTALLVGAAGFAAKSALDARSESAFTPALIPNAAQMPVGSALNFRYPTEKDTASLFGGSQTEGSRAGDEWTDIQSRC